MLAQLPNAFTARPATWDDIELLTELIRMCELVDNGAAEVEAEDIAGDWRRPTMDLSKDSLFVFDANGIAAANAEIFASRAEAHVLPQYRGQGIGTYLAHWIERRGIEQGCDFIRQVVASRSTDKLALLKRAGYAFSDTAWALSIDIEDAPLGAGKLPEGYLLREFQIGSDDAATWRVVEDAFSPWPNREPTTVESWRAMTLQRTDFESDLLPLIEFNGSIVGVLFGIDYPNDNNGWVQQIAVNEQHRGQGIGSALLREAFARFAQRNRTTVGLSTDSRTGALDLYIRTGMSVKNEFTGMALKLNPEQGTRRSP